MPVFILLLLNHLYPIVRDSHSHTIVETNAAILKLRSQSRHSGHLLSDCDGTRIHIVYQKISECEIDYGIRVLIAVLIVAITSEGFSQSMIIIEHGRHAVKSESVKLIFLQPILAVAEKKMEHVVFAIIK